MELKIQRMGKLERRAMMIQRQRMRMTKTSLARSRERMQSIRMRMVRVRKLSWTRTLLQRRITTCDGNKSVMNKQ